jgi:hypothetical protein
MKNLNLKLASRLPTSRVPGHPQAEASSSAFDDRNNCASPLGVVRAPPDLGQSLTHCYRV